ncbi:MAG: ATP-binding cassette domain-containing protein, partial [Chloroflexota bacterium]
IQTAAPQMLQADARHYLGKFLFSGDDAYKKVDVLSGGERGRLALAKLALEDTNLLLLDEPTNHLDIPSQEILEQVLEEYQGTILLVSHDRYLVDALSTQIWEILPNDSTLSIFKGTYSQMREERERLAGVKISESPSAKVQPAQANKASSKQAASKEERRKQAQLQELENLISKLESKLAEIANKLENTSIDPAGIVKLGNEYQVVQKEMDNRLAEWEKLQA